MSPVEIRIHGVGDHKPLSALGRVTLSPQQFSGIDSYVVPATPPHDLELVNWSRASRGIAGFVWYLATPFTLMNVVGYMKPAGEGRRRHGVVTHLASLLITAVLTAWLITITETVLEYVPGLRGHSGWSEGLSAWLPAGAVAAMILVRAHGWTERRIPRALAWGHAAWVVAVTAVVFWWKPAQIEWKHWLNSSGYGGGPPAGALVAGAEPRLDAMMFFVLGSTVLALILACLLRNAAAAIVTMLVFLLLHATGALLRLGASWLMAYLQYIGAVADRSSGMAAADHLLSAADPPGDRVLLLDLVPVTVGGAVVGFAVAFALSAFARKWKGTRGEGPVRRSRFIHRVVIDLPEQLRAALPAVGGVYILLGVAVGGVAFGTSWSGWPLTVALVVTHVSVAGVLVFIIMRGRFSAAPTVYGVVADVAGFWPIRYHPLAGRSYREEVLGGLREKLQSQSVDTVVVVGHSQGSVLSAWLMANERVSEQNWDCTAQTALEGESVLPPAENLYLLTCGSPLKSLYRGFFPAYFHNAFFLRARSRVSAWCNGWRDTDPIATGMPIPGVQEVNLPDDNADDVRGHSYYWNEQALTSWVGARLPPNVATATSSGPTEATPAGPSS
jgi:hypothetical protein